MRVESAEGDGEEATGASGSAEGAAEVEAPEIGADEGFVGI